eukprot:1814312-Rhodomonas_salina.3
MTSSKTMERKNRAVAVTCGALSDCVQIEIGVSHRSSHPLGFLCVILKLELWAGTVSAVSGPLPPALFIF